MNKLQRSWLLLKTSLSVIGRNKVLLVFPLVVFACTAILVLFFLAPTVLQPTGHSYVSGQHWQAVWNSMFQATKESSSGNHNQYVLKPIAFLYFGFVYFVAMLLATFFNVAFYNEILAALNGQPVSIGRGLRFALTRWRPILTWTIFAGLVGLLIKQIEERLPLVGRILARFIGIAWSVASVFAIPVIVREHDTTNPIVALRKSAEALKRTWGEALIGYVGLGIASTMVLIGSLVWLAITIVLASVLHSVMLAIVAGAIWLLALFTWSYVSSVAGHVYRGALYLYAAEGIVAEPFTQDLFNLAWKTKAS